MKKWSIDLPDITSKQRSIMMLIYKFRFLDRKQLQVLMNHKDYKRINIWLKDLVIKGYLSRIYERKIPLNIKPAIYFVAPTGVRFLKRFGNYDIVHKLYREKERSETFRNNCLLIANLYIDLLKKTKHLKALNYFHTKVDMSGYEYEDLETITPYPDMIVSFNLDPSEIINIPQGKDHPKKPQPQLNKKKAKKRKEYRYLMELFNAGVPRYYLRHRIKEYLEFFDETDNGIHPLLCVFPNAQILRFFDRHIQKILEDMIIHPKLKIALTTTEKLQKHGMLGQIWQHVDLNE
jgi:hypothetical protein